MQTNEDNALYLEVQQLYNMLSEAKSSLEEKDKEISMLKEGMDIGKKVLDELSDERDELAMVVNTYLAKDCVRQLMVDAVQKENTVLKKRIAEIKQLMENDLVVVTRKKDFQIKELQRKIEQTVSEKQTLVNETKFIVNKLEKRCEDYEKKERCVKQYVTDVESKLFQANSTIKGLTQDLDRKQEIINEQQKELETANIELRHYRFKDEVNQLLSDVVSGVDAGIMNLMEEYGIEDSGISVKFVVEAADEDE